MRRVLCVVLRPPGCAVGAGTIWVGAAPGVVGGLVVAAGALVGACVVVGVVRGVGDWGAGVIVVDTTNAGTGVPGTRSVNTVFGVGTVVAVAVIVELVVVVVVIGNDNAAFTDVCHSPHPLAFGSTAGIAKFPSTIVAVPAAEYAVLTAA